MKNPQVSVIIPAHNAEKYIEKCLLSLKEQTFRDFEIIVVDDASRDSTFEIAKRYALVIRNKERVGEGASRNRGAMAARGEILAHTDSDVVAPRSWLENIVNSLKDGRVKAVASGYCGSIGNSFIERFSYLELVFRRKDFAGFVNTAVSNNFACHRDVFIDCGGFPEQFKCEDLRLSFRISKKHPILWDKDNGVLHHFRPSLKAYLKQQFYFGRDTVWAYYEYPEMFLKQTHQGKGIYLETFVMFLAVLGIFLHPLAGAILLSLILMLNYRALMFLRKGGLSFILSSLLILARDVVCIISIFAGVGIVSKDIIRRLRGGESYSGRIGIL